MQGKTFEFIGDNKDEKESPKLTNESLVIGDGNSLPTRWHHKQYSGAIVSLFESNLGTDFGLDIMNIVGAKTQNSDANTSRSMAPLFRDSPDQDDFSVKSHIEDPKNKHREGDSEGLCEHPFLLGHKFNADAIKIEFNITSLPLFETVGSSSELHFFETLRAVLVKAIRRELFLGSRSHQLSSFVFKKVVGISSERRTVASALYLYDSIPGGSGILPLIRSYWPRILKRGNSIVLGLEKPFDCCQKACKRCISSYENQSVDTFLNKQILRLNLGANHSATVFDTLQGILEHSAASDHWEFEKARLTVTDPDEPDFAIAETTFRKFLSEKFPSLEYIEQVSLQNDLNHEVTRPDFMLKNADNIFHVFVDGYKYHGKASHFYGDLRKRNFIELNFLGTAVTVPASRVIGKDANFADLSATIASVIGAKLKAPEINFEKRMRFMPENTEYDMPQYDEYNVFYQKSWLKPNSNGPLSHFKTFSVEGVLESTCQAVCVLDAPVLENGYVEKIWWHMFWKEALEFQNLGLRPVFILTKIAKLKAG